jgi:hypothetical protein
MTKIPISHVVKSNRDPVADLFPTKNRSGHILQRDSRAVKGCYLFVGLTAGGEGGLSGKDSRHVAKASRPYDSNICYVYQHRWEKLKCRIVEEEALLKRFAYRNLSESLHWFTQSDEEVGFLGYGRWHSPSAALDLKIVGPQRTFRTA